jgi:hypothetical protein
MNIINWLIVLTTILLGVCYVWYLTVPVRIGWYMFFSTLFLIQTFW